jgi:hypothetical protein
MFTPFAFVKSAAVAGPVIPTSGLVAWYDASDYTSGATWTDKSVNGLNLTLSGTFSKDTGAAMSGSSVFFSNASGITAETSLITGSTGTAYTYIEIIKPTVTGTDRGSFVIGDRLSNYWFGGNGRIYAAWGNGGLGGVYTSAQNYATTKTSFISRRISYGFTTTSNIIVDYADSAGVSLTKYTSFLNALGTPPYNWGAITGANRKLAVGAAALDGSFRVTGYYAVSILYNRSLTDAEVTQIYDSYKTTYVLA